MNARYIFTEFRMYIVWLRYIKYVHKCTAVFIFRSIKMYLVVSRSLKPLDLFSNKWSVFQLYSTGARGTELPPPPFSNFPVTCLFKKKIFIISSVFPLFNLFVSIFIQSYANSVDRICPIFMTINWLLLNIQRAVFQLYSGQKQVQFSWSKTRTCNVLSYIAENLASN